LYSHIEKQICEKILKGFNSPPLLNLGQTLILTKKMQYDCVPKNIITSTLNRDEFFRVSQCNSAKEMWDILEVTHEGTTNVKRARKHDPGI